MLQTYQKQFIKKHDKTIDNSITQIINFEEPDLLIIAQVIIYTKERSKIFSFFGPIIH